MNDDILLNNPKFGDQFVERIFIIEVIIKYIINEIKSASYFDLQPDIEY